MVVVKVRNKSCGLLFIKYLQYVVLFLSGQPNQSFSGANVCFVTAITFLCHVATSLVVELSTKVRGLIPIRCEGTLTISMTRPAKLCRDGKSCYLQTVDEPITIGIKHRMVHLDLKIV